MHKGAYPMTTQTATTKTADYSPGLEGINAGVTSISHVNPGRASLMYRGYDIQDLVQHCTYEEVAFLLIHEHLPTAQELKDFNAQLKKDRAIPKAVLEGLKGAPG